LDENGQKSVNVVASLYILVQAVTIVVNVKKTSGQQRRRIKYFIIID